MKKLTFTLIAVLITVVSFAQNNEKIRKDQSDLFNEFHAGYGALSIYYFTGDFNHSYNYNVSDFEGSSGDYNDPTSPGTFFIGYARSLNNVVSLGFDLGYQLLERDGTHYNYYNGIPSNIPVHATDNVFTGVINARFSYINHPALRLYSGFGIGVTIIMGTETSGDIKGTNRKIFPAGQMTFMGVRFGRAFGGFVEMGIGTQGILSGGISYRFADN